MKKTITTLAIIFNYFTINAQYITPPNFSFEDDTTNFILSKWESNIKNGFSGSINLIRPTDGKFMYSIYSQKNYLDSTKNGYLRNTFSLNTRPTFLTYESMFTNGSSFLTSYRLQILMFKNIGNKRQIICEFDSLIDTKNNFDNIKTWAHFEMDLTKSYKSNLTPDSCILLFTCDIPKDVPFALYVLTLDNIRFNMTTTNTKSINQLNDKLIIYPNPSANLFNIAFNLERNLNYKITLYDIKSSLLFTEKHTGEIGSNTHTLDLSTYAKGTYIVNIEINGKNNSRKIILE